MDLTLDLSPQRIRNENLAGHSRRHPNSYLTDLPEMKWNERHENPIWKWKTKTKGGGGIREMRRAHMWLQNEREKGRFQNKKKVAHFVKWKGKITGKCERKS